MVANHTTQRKKILFLRLVLLVFLVCLSTRAAHAQTRVAPPRAILPTTITIPSAQENDFWDARFSGPPGVDHAVTALAVGAQGEIYVGGDFTFVNGVRVNHVARYDPATSTWSALGGGIFPCEACYQPIQAIAVNGTDVYVGGAFSYIGGLPVSGIAKWDGAQWSALPERPLVGAIQALAVSGNVLYVGGEYGIEKWDGVSWSYLGGNVRQCDGYCVYAIAVEGANVYVAGDFIKAGNLVVNHVARWDGAQWHALGKGVMDVGGIRRPVKALAVHNGEVFIGGSFTRVGDVDANNVARWDGHAWHALGNGVTNCDGCGLHVDALLLAQNELLVGGTFQRAGDVRANHIAVWNRRTEQWSAWRKGVGREHYPAVVKALAHAGDAIVVGGEFTRAGNLSVAHLAQWNAQNSKWQPVGDAHNHSVDDYVHAIAPHGEMIYVGGEFRAAGGKRVNKIARWNSIIGEWTRLGKGIGGVCGTYCRPQVRALTVMENQVFAGGYFTRAGDVTALRVARWDGSAWAALGQGIAGGDFPAVDALANDGKRVYVGGMFTRAGDIDANNIARWDSRRQEWSALGEGTNAPVSALAVLANGDVIAAGRFTRAGNVNVNHIARWDGARWHRLDGGLTRGTCTRCVVDVRGMAVYQNRVYVIGTFNTAGGVTARSIAVWDGHAWAPFGGSDTNYFNNLFGLAITENGTVYVGGGFDGDGGLPRKFIARWDGSAWMALGSGLDTTVFTLAAQGRDVYVGGAFATAGDKPSFEFASWREPNPSQFDDITAVAVKRK